MKQEKKNSQQNDKLGTQHLQNWNWIQNPKIVTNT